MSNKQIAIGVINGDWAVRENRQATFAKVGTMVAGNVATHIKAKP